MDSYLRSVSLKYFIQTNSLHTIARANLTYLSSQLQFSLA